jgi:predicted secreted hydrolase
MGRDWAPFRAAAKRADMAGWVSDQAYCQAE